LVTSERKNQAERRQRILLAAQTLFLRFGLKATTMEAIAAEAGVAKPTLYGYFPDKDAVYQAVVVAFLAEVGAQFDAAIAAGGSVVDRIAGALTAKHKTTHRLLAGSPHAEELYGEHERAPGPAVKALEARIEAAVTELLTGAGVARARPLALLVIAATYGIGRKAGNIAEVGPAIRLVTERVIGPEVK
jgi:AcrR family transcriptional regulator